MKIIIMLELHQIFIKVSIQHSIGVHILFPLILQHIWTIKFFGGAEYLEGPNIIRSTCVQ